MKKIYSEILYWRYRISSGTLCFSQEGEQLILDRIFKNKNTGFYVDCGANHPIRFSNTYSLYRKGWTGMVIDPLPETKKIYSAIRPKDIVVECAIGTGDKSELTYYSFKESAYNTFDNKIAERRIKDGQKLLKSQGVLSKKLADILDENLPNNKHIDYLDIDVEGMDYEVLVSNNWNKYNPSVICVEVGGALSIDEIRQGNIGSLLNKHGYELFSRLFNSAIFVLK